MLDACISSRDFISVAGRPDDVGIRQIRDGETRFTTSHAVVPAGFIAIDRHAGTSHVSVILHVAVEVVRDLVIDRHVIHLPDGQFHAMPSASVHGGDAHSSVISDDEPIGIGGIDPDVVRVSPQGTSLKFSPPSRERWNELLAT